MYPKYFLEPWHQITWNIKIPLLFLTILVSTLAIIWWQWETPLTSPISEASTIDFYDVSSEPDTQDTQYVVYGYLPYWNVYKTAIQPELTHLSYFGLTLDGAGNFQTTDKEGNAEMGYHRLQSDILFTLSEVHGGPVELTIIQFDNDDIVKFLSSDKAQTRFLEGIDNVLLAYPISGINIDIEYSGTVTPQLRQNMSDFMAKLRKHLNSKFDGITLSIAMYASASAGQTIWDVAALDPSVDYIVVMAYDFHQRSSALAGPVAPLLGGDTSWEKDIASYIRLFLKQAPASKILLGVPFYGYEWQTTSRDSRSTTYPNTGSTASFERVQTLLSRSDELEVQEHWNEEALSPYLSYQEDGEIFVVYYENSRSLSYKLDLVKQLNLAGIAIWALGYEGDSRELWDVIQRKL